jgi:hypothetical protein
MIDRLLYAATAVALASLLALDPTFAVNLARAFSGAPVATPLALWEQGAAGILLGLVVITMFRERGRR